MNEAPRGLRLWVTGARPRTLGASVAPVLVGTAVAARYGDVIAWRAAGALVVSVALQVGVNYANDYADGVRGVDRDRSGPLRLTASGLAPAAAVNRAAIGSFTVASVVGIALGLAADWRLIVVGAACVLAGLLYSAGPKPYASAALGEVAVLGFFGFVATCGSAYVHLVRVPAAAVAASLVVGLPAVAVLLANNLRDIPSDLAAGKRTLAVCIGAPTTRRLFAVCLGLGVASIGLVAGLSRTGWALLGVLAAPLALGPGRVVGRASSTPPELVGALVGTARFQLAICSLLAVGLWLG